MKPVETPAALSQETVDHIKDLVRINNDSSKGFADAADVVEDPELKKLFSDMSEQRKRFAGELGHYVAVNDNDESMLSIDNLSGTWKGTLHRWWQDLRGKLSGGDAYAVLAEAERCEDRIKACYEQTIKETAGSPLSDVLHKQYAEIKKGHDGIRDLRDAAKACN